ncbi:MAG: PD-(D/E)XK nuclease family protein, partial [Burkholderiaceae bacterium]
MSLHRLDLPADALFWAAAARAVCDFAERHGARPRQLQALTWLVPAGTHVTLARSALGSAHSNEAFFPPRVVPLSAWLGQPLVAGTAARAELFAALRANRWVRESFGAQPATLWALARDIGQLCDQLTWAAPDGPDALDGELQASLARHFHRRAARTLQPQAQLVLQLWRARRAANDGAVRALRELQSRASHAEAPLVYVGAALSRSAAGTGLTGWEQAFLERYSRRVPVLAMVPGVAPGLRERPLLAAAWPELTGADQDIAIAVRADAIGDSSGAHSTPLSIVAADSLEDEAIAIARQVLSWRQEGVASIALVTLDRLTARRVRALLERAQVSVRDETGWKLSTTSAAAAIMRWYDLVADDLYWRDVLDWLKSTFTLAGRPNKSHEVFTFERAIRASGVLQGARAMRRAIGDLGADVGAESVTGALQILTEIETQVVATQRAGSSFPSHARALRQTLDALGMRSALSLDPVGSALLQELDALEVELMAVEGRATLADFRALLAARFEDSAFVDRQISSPIVMVSLAGTALRSFDAAIVIGADAQHLPAPSTELLFMSNAVCAELGLPTTDDAAREQSAQLAALLTSVPRVVATWRTHQADEPNTLSPLLERLQMVCTRVLGDDLTRPGLDEWFEVEPFASERPAPSAPALLTSRLTASHAQSLVNCAYQFYARRMLGLAALDDVVELPNKRDFGEVLHEILRRFHRTWGAIDFSSLDPAQLATSLAEHARAVFGPKLERAPGLLAYQRRFDGLI